MAELTWQQIVGANASQDATTATIAKADFTGLTASATNTADQLFAALFDKARTTLTSENRTTNPDQSIVIGEPFESRTVENNVRYNVISFTVEFYQPLAGSITLNPMNY